MLETVLYLMMGILPSVPMVITTVSRAHIPWSLLEFDLIFDKCPVLLRTVVVMYS